MKAVTPRALLLLCIIVSCTNAELSADKKKEVLNAHNFYRRAPTPSASNMAMMTWSESIAAVAQSYAANCYNVANTNASSVGFGESRATAQYIPGTVQNFTAALVVGKWAAEANSYVYSTHTCTSLSTCKDYMQMVWAASDQLGCGAYMCSYLRQPSGAVFQNAYFLVCNYATATTVTAGVGATFEHELFWTYNSSKVVNTSNITVTEEAHGDILSVTMEFETLLTQHTGLYQCRVVFSPSNGPTVFDSVADFNIIVREQTPTPTTTVTTATSTTTPSDPTTTPTTTTTTTTTTSLGDHNTLTSSMTITLAFTQVHVISNEGHKVSQDNL
eukprot:Em0011g797a